MYSDLSEDYTLGELVRKMPMISKNNSEGRRRAFTLMEVIVAVALFAMIISFTSVIFNVSADSYRMAMANNEIMLKFRAIVDQINTDFAGIDRKAPLAILCYYENDTDGNVQRYDQVMFFATGDFSSYNEVSGNILYSNAARIYYGQARTVDSGSTIEPWAQKNMATGEPTGILGRRQHVLTVDSSLTDWHGTPFGNFSTADNNREEYDKVSLSRWESISITEFGDLISSCMEVADTRPKIDFDDMASTLHNFLCDGISSFTVQLVETANWTSPTLERMQWFPINAFLNQYTNPLGAYWYVKDGADFTSSGVMWQFEPVRLKKIRAIKFTFTIRDKRGVIKGGRTFTHIVYLGE